MRASWCLALAAAAAAAGCAGGGAEDVSGERRFLPSHLLVRPSGEAVVVGRGSVPGTGEECDQRGTRVRTDVVAVRIGSDGRRLGAVGVPQDEFDACLPQFDAIDAAALVEPDLFVAASARERPGFLQAEGDYVAVSARISLAGSVERVEAANSHAEWLPFQSIEGSFAPVPDIARGASFAGSPAATDWPVGGILPNGDAVVATQRYARGEYALARGAERGAANEVTVAFAPPESNSHEQLVDLKVAPPHGIYVRGEFAGNSEEVDYTFFLYRHRLDLSLDRGFGGRRGRIELGPGIGRHEVPSDFTILPDGRVLALGHLAARDGTRRLWVTRYRRDGRVDGTFGRGGTTIIGYGGPTGSIYSDATGRIAAAPDGSVLVLASRHGRGARLHRLTRSGRLDRSFGRDGVVFLRRV